MEIVKLKNGSEEAGPLVATLMMALERLLAEKPIALYELVMVARDRDHEPFGRCGDDLADMHLLERRTNGTFGIHSSTRNVVLSAITGEGLDLALGSPIAT